VKFIEKYFKILESGKKNQKCPGKRPDIIWAAWYFQKVPPDWV